MNEAAGVNPRKAPDGIALRPLTGADAAGAAALDREIFGGDAWPEELFAAELESRWATYLGAFNDGRLVGVGGITGDLEGDLMTLGVLPAWRGQGLGRHLCERLLDLVRDRGMSAVILEVRAGNLGAIALYSHLGFVPVRRIPRYYSAPMEDAVMMRLEL